MLTTSQKSVKLDIIDNLCLCLKLGEQGLFSTFQTYNIQPLATEVKFHIHTTRSAKRCNIYNSFIFTVCSNLPSYLPY